MAINAVVFKGFLMGIFNGVFMGFSCFLNSFFMVIYSWVFHGKLMGLCAVVISVRHEMNICQHSTQSEKTSAWGTHTCNESAHDKSTPLIVNVVYH
jgi:hypothetical protein